jgi:hypothetical protein
VTFTNSAPVIARSPATGRFPQLRNGPPPAIPHQRSASLTQTDSYTLVLQGYPAAIFQSAPGTPLTRFSSPYTPPVSSPLGSQATPALPLTASLYAEVHCDSPALPASSSPLSPLVVSQFNAQFPSLLSTPPYHPGQLLGMRRSISADSELSAASNSKQQKLTAEELLKKARKAKQNAARPTLNSFQEESLEVFRCVNTAFKWTKAQCMLCGPFFEPEARASLPQEAFAAALEQLGLPPDHMELSGRMTQFVCDFIFFRPNQFLIHPFSSF